MGEHEVEKDAPSTTRVVRIRLPRDRSFLYLRIDRQGRRITAHAELIARRYYSHKRVEVMTFRTHVTPPAETRGINP